MRVGDILQRIRVEHDEVGFFAGGHRAHASQSENLRVHRRSRLNGLGCREPAARIVGNLLVRAKAIAGSIGPEADDHSGIVDSLYIAAVKLEEFIRLVPGRFPCFELATHGRDG